MSGLRVRVLCLGLVAVAGVLLTPPSSARSGALQRLPWRPQGYREWVWRGHRINFVDEGAGEGKPPLLLVHGFGASVYHCKSQRLLLLVLTMIG